MRESTIEAKIKRIAEKHGCMCWKLTSPGTRGVPDRLIMAPNGLTGFIEVKAPGCEPTKLQLHMIGKLKKQNQRVIWTSCPDEAEKFILDLINDAV